MRHCVIKSVPLALLLSGGVAALAQQSHQPPGTVGIPGVPPMLQLVDPARQDVGPLSDSLRDVNIQTDLRSPAGFQNVYRVPGRDDMLMRASGGIYAVFPQSVYVATDQGVMVEVPPGTIYTIGAPSNWMLPPRSLGPSMVLERPDRIGAPAAMSSAAHQGQGNTSQALVTRIVPRQGVLVNDDEWSTAVDDSSAFLVGDTSAIAMRQAVPATPPEPSQMLRTIATDPEYRAQRLAELMRIAVEAARSGGR
jgi:hypothetical protein